MFVNFYILRYDFDFKKILNSRIGKIEDFLQILSHA